MLGVPVEKPKKNLFDLDYVGIKASQFSFNRLQKADPVLGVDMSSTGEVGCLGDDTNTALLKSMLAVGHSHPREEHPALHGCREAEGRDARRCQVAPAARLQALCHGRHVALSDRERCGEHARLLAFGCRQEAAGPRHAPREADRHGGQHSEVTSPSTSSPTATRSAVRPSTSTSRLSPTAVWPPPSSALSAR